MIFCKRVDFTQFCLAARCFLSIFFPFCVFHVSPDIESCTLKEYLIIYSVLTSHSHYPSVVQVFLASPLLSGLSGDGKVKVTSPLLSLIVATGDCDWASSDEK